MRCLIHDFAGHPFQVQLSRELASRGHHVTHVYPQGLQGPKGRLEAADSDSRQLEILGVPLGRGFRKYSAWRRLAAQRQYALDLRRIVSARRFDVVLSGNTPVDVQFDLLGHCRRSGIGFVHWVQDVYCQALTFFLRRRFGRWAEPLSAPFRFMERSVASRSDASIVIAPDFARILTGWGVPPEKIAVLENWAPLNEVQPLPRNNGWSREHGLDSRTVFLYSGTLGMKHRPDLLYALAKSAGTACTVVTISEGPGREYLESLPKLPNLVLLNYQPYDRLSEVLASADVLVATLETDAGQFAVPSKILSYLCAGRPLLLAAPRNNLAAAIVERSGAGLVVDPDSPFNWTGAAQHLAADPRLRRALGATARRYAEREFDIARIATRFEEVLRRAMSASSRQAAAEDLIVEPAPGAEFRV
jgi:glycosyltransferase involved in cell wall biosynthesis